ncbi:hypothetical protein SE17_00170 [Kouleothrix aurantiaca]|uniref:Uncharacterized protein n=1 Tax=Kouleothrix aurantiaca TaxID=186479 RepID=A0A0P9DHQ3_9CHLR|nr:hypothetical protein SE17_00170 [Kouleothrix aurantiaca]
MLFIVIIQKEVGGKLVVEVITHQKCTPKQPSGSARAQRALIDLYLLPSEDAAPADGPILDQRA